ncbi:MAG: hypothetical protein WBG50_17060 [Desulfomonilaceae bacterium]
MVSSIPKSDGAITLEMSNDLRKLFLKRPHRRYSGMNDRPE